jgi:hypothetical protein
LPDLTKKVHDLLQITKLYTGFDVKDDEADAIKSFNSQSKRLGEAPDPNKEHTTNKEHIYARLRPSHRGTEQRRNHRYPVIQ